MHLRKEELFDNNILKFVLNIKKKTIIIKVIFYHARVHLKKTFYIRQFMERF